MMHAQTRRRVGLAPRLLIVLALFGLVFAAPAAAQTQPGPDGATCLIIFQPPAPTAVVPNAYDFVIVNLEDGSSFRVDGVAAGTEIVSPSGVNIVSLLKCTEPDVPPVEPTPEPHAGAADRAHTGAADRAHPRADAGAADRADARADPRAHARADHLPAVDARPSRRSRRPTAPVVVAAASYRTPAARPHHWSSPASPCWLPVAPWPLSDGASATRTESRSAVPPDPRPQLRPEIRR